MKEKWNSPEWREFMVNNFRNRIRTKEENLNNSLAQKEFLKNGGINSFKDKKHTQETRDKIKEKRSKQIISEKTKLKMSNSRKKYLSNKNKE